MTMAETNEELCRHRNLALTKYGNALLDRGFDVDGEEFRELMLSFAADAERWRMWALQKIAARTFGATKVQSTALN